jgi:CO/xanthine dehydrogenase FAD-binding subunit
MMRLPKFTYRVPREIGDAVRMMGDAGPEGQFVAGGTDLYPNMKRRPKRAQHRRERVFDGCLRGRCY